MKIKTDSLENFMKATLDGLLESSGEVEYNLVRGEKAIVFEIRIPKREFGRVIGKKGSHLAAITRLATAIAAREGYLVTLDFTEK